MYEFVDEFFTVKVPTSPPPPSVPVRQWSFDNLDGLVLMEMTVQATFSALTTGKVVNQYICQKLPDLRRGKYSIFESPAPVNFKHDLPELKHVLLMVCVERFSNQHYERPGFYSHWW